MFGSNVHSHWLVRNLKIPAAGHVSTVHKVRPAQVHKFHSHAHAKTGTQDLSSSIASQEAMPLRFIFYVSRGCASFASHLRNALMILQEAREA